MNSTKISVIVPVYNVSKYIERCVRSLMEQTLREEIEFIFINDATPDNSMTILDDVLSQYPDRKEQVHIIQNPKNLGICETRKRGIEAAKGEYIGWCDSDDWCELNMFEYLLAKSCNSKYDIVVCDTFIHTMKDGKDKVSIWNWMPSKTPEQAVINFSKGKSIPSALWCTLSKKSLIKETSLKVYPVSYSEDTWMILHSFINASMVYWTQKPLYHYYVMSEKSLTKMVEHTKETWKAQKINIERILTELEATEYVGNLKETINYIKLFWKRQYRDSFESVWDYWSTYKEAYRHICIIDKTPYNKRCKVWLTYNFYPLFWLANRKTFKH